MKHVNGYNFLSSFFCSAMRGRVALLIVCVLGLGATGCGVRTAPVSSSTTQIEKRDSITKVTETKKDSSFYRETVTEKTLPGSTVGVTLSKEQLDSLIQGLRAMPSSVTRSIYRTDPRMQTTLAIILDSLGRIHFKCITSERSYYEISKSQQRWIENVKSENTKIKTENMLLKAEVREMKKSFWEKLKNGFNSWIVRILLGFIAVGILIVVYDVSKTKILALWKSIKVW